MTYQIISKNGRLFVAAVAQGKIVRICRECSDRADAEQLLHDLAGWRF